MLPVSRLSCPPSPPPKSAVWSESDMAASSSAARPSLEEACNILLQNEDAAFTAATEMLFKIVQNIVTHPSEDKYRALKRSNPTFAAKVCSAKGGVRFLKATGFIEQGTGDDATFALPADVDPELLGQAKAALKAVVRHRTQQMSRANEAERMRENAEAAQKLADLRRGSARHSSDRSASPWYRSHRVRGWRGAHRRWWGGSRTPSRAGRRTR